MLYPDFGSYLDLLKFKLEGCFPRSDGPKEFPRKDSGKFGRMSSRRMVTFQFNFYSLRIKMIAQSF